jgi:hypothetical protein
MNGDRNCIILHVTEIEGKAMHGFVWECVDQKSPRSKAEKGKCLIYGKEEDPLHIMLKCSRLKFQSEIYIKNE